MALFSNGEFTVARANCRQLQCDFSKRKVSATALSSNEYKKTVNICDKGRPARMITNWLFSAPNVN